MVELVQNAQVPKSYSSFITYLDNVQKGISSTIGLLLGTGIASDDVNNVAATVSTSYTLDNGTYILNFLVDYDVPLSITYENAISNRNDGFFVDDKVKGAKSYVVPFDESEHIINGSSGNPVSLPYPTQVFYVPNYTVDNLGIIYVNGTPQKKSDVTVTGTSGQYALVSFSKITDGFIYPDPRLPNGDSTTVVFGDTLANWFSEFGSPIELTFSNLKISATNRPLLLDLYDVNTDVRAYLLVHSSFQEDKPYYEITSTNKLKIHIPQQTLDIFDPASTITKIYFVEVAELAEVNTATNRFVRQYKLPVTNILPDNSDLVIFSISKTTGKVTELVSLSNALIGDLYNLDPINGTLTIYNVDNLIPEDEVIAVAGYKYEPPMRPHNISDYTNQIVLYYNAGGTYIKNNVTSSSDLPANLFVYFYPDPLLDSLTSFLDAGGNIVTSPQLRIFKNSILISETPLSSITIPESFGFPEKEYKPVEFGTLVRSGYVYTFVPNQLASDPYQKLLDLAANLQLITQNSFTSVKVTNTYTISSGTPLVIPIDYVPPTATELAFYGLAGKLKVTDNADATVTKQYEIRLGYYDAVGDSFVPQYTVGSFDSGINNGFIEVMQNNFPQDVLWSTLTPNTGKYLALQIIVTNPSGETAFDYEVNLTNYINTKY